MGILGQGQRDRVVESSSNPGLAVRIGVAQRPAEITLPAGISNLARRSTSLSALPSSR